MNISPRLVRILIQVPAVVFLLLVSEKSINFAPFYFGSKQNSRSFLEDSDKDGQAKAQFAALFSHPEDPHWYRRDTATLAKLIRLHVDAEQWSEQEVKELSQYILFLSYMHGVPPSLVLSLIQVESNFRSNAVSHKGAKGLMQLMPATAEAIAVRKGLDWYGPQTLEDPKRNIEFALHYIVELRDRFRRPDLILVAYNLGPNALEKKIENGEDIPMGFYQKVIAAMRFYQSQMRAPITASSNGRMRWL